jgi:hypothetical protein
LYKFTDVSREHTPFVIKGREVSRHPARSRQKQTPNMEAVHFSEKSVNFYQNTWPPIPEGNHYYESPTFKFIPFVIDGLFSAL